MSEERFVDNGNGTVTDSESGLTWLQKDSRQMAGKWMHLEKAERFAKEKNEEQFGGFSDWRVPKLEDVKTIFDRSYRNMDFGRNEIYIPKVFESGGADCTWTDTINGERAMLFSLVKGRSSWINRLGDGPFAVRLCRGERNKE